MRDLHNEIMNMRCDPGDREPTYALAYKLGHRDARHAAAELAARYEAVTEYEIKRNRAAIDELVEALKPFADLAEHYPMQKAYGNRPTSGTLIEVCSANECAQITVEDLHHAGALIAKHQTTTEKER